MVCIYCGSPTTVNNSRLQRRANQTWRRRHCTGCNSVFTTLEAADLSQSLVVQYSSKHLEAFNRDTLLISIYEALKHRQSALADASALTNTIVGFALSQTKDGRIDRQVLVQLVVDTLIRFDKPAATIYQAYHRL